MSWDDVVDGPVYNLLSSKFYKNWKRFLSNPNNSPPDSVDNESILCDTHKRFLFPPQDDSYVGPNEKYVFIITGWTTWRAITKFIQLTREPLNCLARTNGSFFKRDPIPWFNLSSTNYLNRYIIIPDTEWRKLVSFYKFDNAISFFKLEDQQIISAPGIFYFVLINWKLL